MSHVLAYLGDEVGDHVADGRLAENAGLHLKVEGGRVGGLNVIHGSGTHRRYILKQVAEPYMREAGHFVGGVAPTGNPGVIRQA